MSAENVAVKFAEASPMGSGDFAESMVETEDNGSSEELAAVAFDEPTRSFLDRAQSMPPLEHRGRLALTCFLNGAELPQLRRLLESEGSDSLLCRYIEEHLKGCDVSATPWRDGDVHGTRVCQLRFRMPLPADAPEAFKRLAAIPSHTTATVMAQFQCDDSQLLLHFESQAHDAPFGNNFWVADQFCFEARPSGVQLQKFSGLRWTQSLPWYAGIVGTVAESKASASAGEAGEAFARIAETA
jgi:hypothetical protein